MGINTTLIDDGRRSVHTPRAAHVVFHAGFDRGAGPGLALPTGRPRRSPIGIDGLADIVAGLARVRGMWRFEDGTLPVGRDGRRLLATEAYEAWLLAWSPGSSVEPHDHGDSDGAFVVCSGELAEVRWAGSRQHTRRLGAGDCAAIPASVVHDVVAVGSGTAFSIHAYSPPLREMRFYDAQATTVVAVRPVVEEPTLLSARAVAAALHPANRV